MEDCLSIFALEFEKCPGRYCGRILLAVSNCTFSECQKCPRGYRVSELGVCQPCKNELSLYDYMYLGFVLNFAIILNFEFIDRSLWQINKKKYKLTWLKIFSIYFSCTVECLVAFIFTILLISPNHTLKLYTCSVHSIYDWYSIFFNPYIDYYQKLNCSQEIVYPLYSFCLIFYLLAILIMVCIRPLFIRLVFNDKIITKIVNEPTFAALYFYPLLIIIHVVAGGVLYYAFPYITIVVFLISNAFYLCTEFKKIHNNQTLLDTIVFTVKLFKKPRHIFLMLIHWYFYSFAIISMAAFKVETNLEYFYLLLVPLPLIFFVISYKHTDPENFKP